MKVIHQLMYLCTISLLPCPFLAPAAPIIVDNKGAVFEGSWTVADRAEGKYGEDYSYSFAVKDAPTATAYYRPTIIVSGLYHVEIMYPQRSTRSSEAPWVVFHDGGAITTRVDQAAMGGKWVRIAEDLPFSAGTNGYVMISNATGDAGPKSNGKSHVVADAVRWVPAPKPELARRPGFFAAIFDEGQPERTQVHGSAAVRNNVLQLTPATRNQLGSFLIDPFYGEKPVLSFVTRFKAFIGGGNGADGLGFALAPRLPQEAFNEAAIPKGLVIVLDTFKNGDELVPSARIIFNQSVLQEIPIVNLRAGRFVDVMAKVDPNGTLDFIYDGQVLVTNLLLGTASFPGQFAFFGRTGGQTDEHSIDDLEISAQTVAGPFVESFQPAGTNASPSSRIEIFIRDFVTPVDSGSIRLAVDEIAIRPELERQLDGTLISFEFPNLLEPGSGHSVQLAYASSTLTNSLSYSFVVTQQVRLTK